MILRNSARCETCGEELVSIGHHDFVTCSCGNLSVDGGRRYLKRYFVGPFTETSYQVPDEEDE